MQPASEHAWHSPVVELRKKPLAWLQTEQAVRLKQVRQLESGQAMHMFMLGSKTVFTGHTQVFK
jgi:hypothetical protein